MFYLNAYLSNIESIDLNNENEIKNVLWDLIIKKSMNYYKNGQDRIFIYKSLENDIFLCGDSEDISDATKYTIKSFNELRKEQILHLKYKKLSKAEIKDLRKELKSNK